MGEAKQGGRLAENEEPKRQIVRELQGDFPRTREPYDEIAGRLGLSCQELLEIIDEMKSSGVIRRIGAILRHQEAGMKANGMGVWNIPEQRVEEVGKIMASFPEVSHRYHRAPFEGWEYNMYTMIHGRTEEACWNVVREIAGAIGIKDYDLLFSQEEYKKVSMQYFVEDE